MIPDADVGGVWDVVGEDVWCCQGLVERHPELLGIERGIAELRKRRRRRAKNRSL